MEPEASAAFLDQQRHAREMARFAAVGGQQGRGRRASEAAAGHAQLGERLSGVGGQQVPRLLEDGVEGPVPIGRVARALAGERCLRSDVVDEFANRQRRDARCSELEMERYAVEQAAQFGDVVGVLRMQRERLVRPVGAVDEQSHGGRLSDLGAIGRRRESGEDEDVLGCHVEDPSRGDDGGDVGAGPEEIDNEVAGGVHELLEVVEDKAQTPARDRGCELCERVCVAEHGVGDQEVDDGRRELLWRRDRRERRPHHRARLGEVERSGDLGRHARLADPARPDDGEQAIVTVSDALDELRDLVVAAQKRRHVEGDVGGDARRRCGGTGVGPAGAKRVGERSCLVVGFEPQAVLEGIDAALVLRQGRGPATAGGGGLHQEPVSRLVPRLQLDHPRGERRAVVPALVASRLVQVLREAQHGRRPQALAAGVDPVHEDHGLGDVDAGEEVSPVVLHDGLAVAGRDRGAVVGRVDRQPHPLAVGPDDVAQRRAQAGQRDPEVRSGPVLRDVGPEQPGQSAAPGGSAGVGEVHDHQCRLLGDLVVDTLTVDGDGQPTHRRHLDPSGPRRPRR